jgi:hypothetical protein
MDAGTPVAAFTERPELRFPQGLRSLNVQVSLIDSTRGLRCRMASGVHQRVRQRDLNLDLLAAQHRRAGQGGNLGKRTTQVNRSTNAERASARYPALPHRPAAFSISPASVQ